MRSISLAVCCLLLVGVAALHAGEEQDGVYDIPKLDHIVVDGNAEDWGDDGFRIGLLAPVGPQLKPITDHNVLTRLAWDARGLLLLLAVSDDTWVEHPEEDKLWMYDSIQVYLAPQRGASNMCQWAITPGMDPQQSKLRWHLHDYRKDEALRTKPAKIEAARVVTDATCRVEILLPWASLGIEPVEGGEVGFQLLVGDADNVDESQVYTAAWFPALGTFMHSDRMHRLRLSREAGSFPAVIAEVATDPKTWRKQVLLIGGPEYEERLAAIVESKVGSPQHQSRILAKARFAKDKSGRPAARLLPPKKTTIRPGTRIDLTIGGKLIAENEIVGKASYSSVSRINLRWIWERDRSSSPSSLRTAGSFYETDIPPTGEAKYKSALYRLWVPDKVKILRGIIVHQHGCGQHGITMPYDLQWQALALKWDCGLMGTHYTSDECGDWCEPDNGSELAFLSAIKSFAEQSGHAELVNAPWVLWGHSGGAHWTTRMLDKHPKRIVAAFLRSGGVDMKSDGILRVPVLYCLGVGEQSMLPGLWKNVHAAFKDGRPRGSLMSLAIDPKTAHDCGRSRLLAIPFFDACLAQRLPVPGVEPVTLKPMDPSAAWLGNMESFSIASASKYQGDPLLASWLPAERVATYWREYVKTGWVTDTTPPVAPANVKTRVLENGHVEITWDAAADVESGIMTFYVYRNGHRIESYRGSLDDFWFNTRKGIFQYSDNCDRPKSDALHKDAETGERPLMRFVDSDVRPGAKYSYRISTVNHSYLESDVSRPARIRTPK